MSVQNVIEKSVDLLGSIGESALNSFYPNDFQYYMIALELVTGDNKTIDYFAFPVSPENIQQIEPQITNIKKTVGGINSLSTTSFIPKDITIRGTFGSKFRLLLRNKSVINFSAFRFSGVQKKEDIQNNNLKKLEFDPSIKNGYGCIKVLQSICDKSVMVDNTGLPVKLFFYNPILGDNYLVKVLDFTSSMSRDTNRLIYYTLRLKAIAPLNNMNGIDETSMTKVLTVNNLQKGANMIVSEITKKL